MDRDCFLKFKHLFFHQEKSIIGLDYFHICKLNLIDVSDLKHLFLHLPPSLLHVEDHGDQFFLVTANNPINNRLHNRRA